MIDYIASPSGDISIYQKSVRHEDACRGYEIHYNVSSCNPKESKYNLVVIEGVMTKHAPDATAPYSNVNNISQDNPKVQIVFLILI